MSLDRVYYVAGPHDSEVVRYVHFCGLEFVLHALWRGVADVFVFVSIVVGTTSCHLGTKLGEKAGTCMPSKTPHRIPLRYYPHYFAHTGLYSLLGSESAQGLPNDQLYYSFLRGAAKQYGNLWWASASIFNRWGQKSCHHWNIFSGGVGLYVCRYLLSYKALDGSYACHVLLI